MRYPSDLNKSDSTNISDGQLLEYDNSPSTSAVATSSASSTSQDERDAVPNNVSTISEHVLFGNNNGQNSFLYLYYSRSSKDNAGGDTVQRPYTTQGSKSKTGKLGQGMGSQQEWNDLSGGFRSNYRITSRGSAGPSPTTPKYTNNNDEKETTFTFPVQNTKEQFTQSNSSSHQNYNDNTPYPVYLSPEEEQQGLAACLTPEKLVVAKMDEEDANKKRKNRQDSITESLLDDDDDEWMMSDKLDAIPDVGPAYMFSSGLNYEDKLGDDKPINDSSNELSPIDTKPLSSIEPLPSTSTETSLQLPTSSKRVRVAHNNKIWEGGGAEPFNKWSGTNTTKSNLKLSPFSPTQSAKSLKMPSPLTQNGVTHHHHTPHTGSIPNQQITEQGKRVSTTTTGDGLDQISFRNGIGAFFGTPASRKISQSRETSPEEMFKQEMQGWKPRLATVGTFFSATLFILSSFSLLFVFPLLVDPILVGFEAKFSTEPVTCRTTNFRNGSGAAECATPSCREGCTIDLFSCIFVDVEYTMPASATRMNADEHLVPHLNNSSQINNKSLQLGTPTTHSATLLINVNGCGYPPEVICSDFVRKYSSISSEYPCHYSQTNQSIVVPHYNRRKQELNLTFAVGIPVGIAIFSGISLGILTRYLKHLKASIYRKYASRKRALKEKRNNERKARKEEAAENTEDDATSISEIAEESHENVDNVNEKGILNGASKIGIEESKSTKQGTHTRITVEVETDN